VRPPSIPGGLTAAAVSSSRINLSWNASTDNVGVAGYKVLRGGVQIATTSALTYADTALSPSTAYSYTVAAYGTAGNTSAPSSTASATTQAATPPSIPTGLSASAISASQINLSWNASTDPVGVTGYNVMRNSVLIAAVSALTYANTGLSPSTTYTYTVAAFNAAGYTSAQSAPLLVTTPTSTPPGPAQRPAYNTGTGFFILGKTLYDAAGYEFRIRGVNKAHTGSSQYTIANNMKANAVRWVMWDPANTQAEQVAAANAWIAQKIVPIPGNWTGTCKELPSDLTPIVDLWVAQAASWTTSDFQRYAIISVANEWGPSNSAVWRDSYITAIQRMRAAGYKQTLMIDSGGCGQDAADLLQYAQAVFDSDPQKNVIFDLHIYGNWTRPATASWQQDYDTLLARMSLLNVPIVIGEFGPGRNIGPSPTPITPLEVMTTAEGYKWGWMAWAADDNDLANGMSSDNWFGMLYNNAVYNSSADLTIFGKVVVDNPIYGLKAIAVKAVALTGTPPLP
jgi:chitodextrinase